MSLNMYKKVIVVTGANRGIGYGIIESFCRDKREFLNDRILILTSRDKNEGLNALEKLRRDYPEAKNTLYYHILDVTHGDSVKKFKRHLVEDLNAHISVLYNNAAVMHKHPGDDRHEREKGLIDTFNTNVWGLINVTEDLLPVIKPGGHIINMSTTYAKMKFAKSNVDRFMDEKLTVDDLHKLYHEYRNLFIHNQIDNSVWDMNAYGRHFNANFGAYPISKVFVNAYTRILAKRLKDKDINIKVNAVSPGWVKTRLGGQEAPKSILQGAEVPFWMAFFPEERNDELSGNFYTHTKTTTTWI